MEVSAIITGGRYEILSCLGKGGMSEVYLAEDTRLHVKWTIKRIRAGGGSKSYLSGSVISEANVLRKVRHPALPKIVDIFREGDHINLVMEYIEGRTLEQVIKSSPLTEDRLLDIAIEICSALECLHSMKPPVIYRDLKPSNIMIRPDGSVCLIDFGTAKQILSVKGNKDTTMLGTLGFAAPEQFRGRTDERSDIYSLGMTLKACSSKEKIPGNLKKIIEKCTALKPEERYRDIRTLTGELRRLKHRKRRLVLVSVIGFMSLICLAGVMYGVNAGKEMNRAIGNTVSGADLYMRYVQSGNEAYFTGDYAGAEHEYTRAIVEVDPSRDTAYLQLLKLYRKLDLSEEGLDRLDVLMRDNEFLTDRDELYYECALTAFYDCNDCARAGNYLQNVDTLRFAEAGYLLELTELSNSLDTDIAAVIRVLSGFEEYNAKLPEEEKRLKNDINIATLYLTYCDEIDGCLNSGKALLTAEKLTKEALKITMGLKKETEEEYLVKELGMLSTIDRLLGNKYRNRRDEYYSQAIDYTRQLLNEEDAYDNDSEVRLKLLYMARMYRELGEYGEALGCYLKSEELYPYKGTDIYLGHLSCLIEMKAGKEEIRSLYDKALKVEGLGRSPEFAKIKEDIQKYLKEAG